MNVNTLRIKKRDQKVVLAWGFAHGTLSPCRPPSAVLVASFFFGCLLKRPWVGEKQELCTKTDTLASNSGVNTSSVSFCIRPERGPEKHSESVASRRQQCLSWETTQKREKGEEGRTGALGSGSAHMWGFRTALKGLRWGWWETSLEKKAESGHEMPPHLGEDLEVKPEDGKKLLGCLVREVAWPASIRSREIRQEAALLPRQETGVAWKGVLGDGVKEVDWVNSKKFVRQNLVMNWIWPGMEGGEHVGQGIQGVQRRGWWGFCSAGQENRNTETLEMPAGAGSWESLTWAGSHG